MPRQDDLDSHLSRALDHCVDVVNLEPQQHSVAVGFVIAVPDPAVMVLHFEAMQLQDKLAIGDQLLILRAAMIALATQ